MLKEIKKVNEKISLYLTISSYFSFFYALFILRDRSFSIITTAISLLLTFIEWVFPRAQNGYERFNKSSKWEKRTDIYVLICTIALFVAFTAISGTMIVNYDSEVLDNSMEIMGVLIIIPTIYLLIISPAVILSKKGKDYSSVGIGAIFIFSIEIFIFSFINYTKLNEVSIIESLSNFGIFNILVTIFTLGLYFFLTFIPYKMLSKFLLSINKNLS